MKKKITIPIYVSLLLSLSGCGDCMQIATGIVLDAQTGLPIQGAHAQNELKAYAQADTDETGKFEIESISGGLFGCPHMDVVITMPGYEPQTVKIAAGGQETIKLNRKN